MTSAWASRLPEVVAVVRQVVYGDASRACARGLAPRRRSSILLVAPHHPRIKRTPGGTVGGAPALRS